MKIGDCVFCDGSKYVPSFYRNWAGCIVERFMMCGQCGGTGEYKQKRGVKV